MASLGPSGKPLPENHEQWAAAHSSGIADIQELTKNLLTQLQQNDDCETKILRRQSLGVTLTQKFGYDKKPGVAASLPGLPRPPVDNRGPGAQRKIDDSINLAKDCAHSVDSVIEQIGVVVLRLNKSHSSKWGALKMCEWRLDLRSKRPQQERFKDVLQEDLEKEREGLLDARKQIQDQTAETKKVHEDLQAFYLRLSKLVRVTMQEAASVGSVSVGSGTVTQVNEMVAKAAILQQQGLATCKKADIAILRIGSDCSKAAAKSSASLTKRCGDLMIRKKALEAQVVDVDAAMVTAEKGINKTKRRLEEMTQDDPAVPAQRKQLEGTEALFEKLMSAKVALEDDLKAKSISLKIDEACRKVTPEKTTTKADRTSVVALARGLDSGGLQAMPTSPSARKSGSMWRASSSPGLGRFSLGDFGMTASTTDTALSPLSPLSPTSPVSPGAGGSGGCSSKPGSPAGASRTLKAAGSQTGLA